MKKGMSGALALITGLAALLPGIGAQSSAGVRVAPDRVSAPGGAAITAQHGRRFRQLRADGKGPKPRKSRPVYGAHHDPRSGFVGAKLRRKAAEGKL